MKIKKKPRPKPKLTAKDKAKLWADSQLEKAKANRQEAVKRRRGIPRETEKFRKIYCPECGKVVRLTFVNVIFWHFKSYNKFCPASGDFLNSTEVESRLYVKQR